MKSEILRLLRESKEYVSGQQLCDRYNVSRTAVWKVMEQLKQEGYQIEAVRNKGYRLIHSPDIMTTAEIESLMETNWAGKQIVCFQETDSTNTQAKALGEKAGRHGTLVVAERQLAGKGRRGRVWESPDGTSIYMTILLKPLMSPANAPMLTLVMALSAAEGIKNRTGIATGIKWPNDIVADGKKVCGILTEMSAEVDYINYVVVGIGINVNEPSFPGELGEKAISLRMKCGRTVRRSDLIAGIIQRFEVNYERFMKTEDFSQLMIPYNELLVNCNKQVRVLSPGQEYDAVALGINRMGELRVKKADGEESTVFAGEVSVRGIYGYI